MPPDTLMPRPARSRDRRCCRRAEQMPRQELTMDPAARRFPTNSNKQAIHLSTLTFWLDLYQSGAAEACR